ncbi:peptide ABC transporter substrate-binding protein [Chengkuizengella axinellae]|uniref:Peptide ABC transporter substrate-binding protein n=1 Tax=Chengkuizengella axinellae TaxID=3064388 RepID=A0ABT9J1Q6_9BACL|nr:peptide ABC transporter substrate-binding protein [Chengkuizengella sp. 2205SS18-9]MDP5275544.1 peptide ABC transporter substrate-binding protein [Chengkuizengella sp. 2205SS18-9]
MKSNNKRVMMILALFMAVIVGLAACSGGDEATPATSDSDTGTTTEGTTSESSGESEGSEQVFVTGTSEPTSLSPVHGSYTQDQLIMNNIFDGLMQKLIDETIVPGIAESYELNGNTYTFKIRDNAKWSNGDPVTAHDFEFGWKTALDPRNAGEYSWIFELIALEGYAELGEVELPEEATAEELEALIRPALDNLGFKAVDDSTFEVQVTDIVPQFLELMAFPTFYPINEEFYNSVGGDDGYASELDKLLYNGPFVISDWSHDDKIVLSPNEEYWDRDAVKLDKVVLELTGVSTREQRFDNKEFDLVMNVGPDFIDLYKDRPEATQYAKTQTSWFLMNLVNKDTIEGKFLNNKDFREAMSLGIDRNVVTAVTGGVKVPASGILPTGLVGSSPDADFRTEFSGNADLLRYDPERAKELVAKAVAEIGADVPEISVGTYSGDTANEMQIIQEQLRQVGIPITLEIQDSKVRREQQKTFEYHIIYTGWFADYNEPTTYLDLFTTTGFYSVRNGYSNTKYDALKEKSKAVDGKERFDIYGEMERIVLSDYAFIPTVFDGYYTLQQEYVKDLGIHASGPPYSFKWTYIDGK